MAQFDSSVALLIAGFSRIAKPTSADLSNVCTTINLLLQQRQTL